MTKKSIKVEIFFVAGRMLTYRCNRTDLELFVDNLNNNKLVNIAGLASINTDNVTYITYDYGNDEEYITKQKVKEAIKKVDSNCMDCVDLMKLKQELGLED